MMLGSRSLTLLFLMGLAWGAQAELVIDRAVKNKAQFALSEDALRYGRLKPAGTRG